MDKNINLSFNEIYYLGKYMDAKYLDYSYIASIDDIDTNYDLFVSTVKSSLSSKGFITEDFTGNVSVDPKIAQLIKPIYYSEDDSEVMIIISDGEHSNPYCKKVHFYNDDYVVVSLNENDADISKDLSFQTEIDVVSEFIKDYECNGEELDAKKFDAVPLSTAITVKKVSNLVSVPTKTFCIYEGVVYECISEEKLKMVTKEYLESAINDALVKGE